MKMNRGELQINLAKNILIISVAMLFATLFMGYGIYRTSAEVWPPAGTQTVPLILPVISTLFIFISSLFCHGAQKFIKKNEFELAQKKLSLTLLFGLGFMATQTYLWHEMKTLGLIASSGIFASLIYAFTWIHFAHMVAGIASLFYLKMILKPETKNLLVKATSIEHFWYFLEIIWLLMFFTLFVI